MARNIIRLNTGLFEGFPSIVIPSLIGLSKELNPDEVLLISPSHASWISNLKKKKIVSEQFWVFHVLNGYILLAFYKHSEFCVFCSAIRSIWWLDNERCNWSTKVITAGLHSIYYRLDNVI